MIQGRGILSDDSRDSDRSIRRIDPASVLRNRGIMEYIDPTPSNAVVRHDPGCIGWVTKVNTKTMISEKS